MKLFRWIPLLVGMACNAEKSDTATVSDTGDTAIVEQPERPESCTPELKVDGTPIDEMPPPAPEDSWRILMYCGGALQTGTYVLEADPAELVRIDSEEPIVTFVAEGTVTLDYRMGSRRASADIAIGG